MNKSITPYVFDKKQPFNLELLKLTSSSVSSLKEINTVDTFQPSSNEFDTEGLFSVPIFGSVGSPERMDTFAYMDLGIQIMHPLLYKTVTSLKTLYKDIIEGKKYATFDPKLKDFIETSITEGETGFNFFIKYLPSLEPTKTNSKDRDNKIKLIKQYTLNEMLTDKWLVLPAGLREFIITDNKQMEAEINDYYRNIIRLSKTAKTLNKSNVSKDDSMLNTVTIKLTKAVCDLYDYIINILDGKQGFLQGKWSKRGLAHGTRNVLTGFLADTDKLDEPGLSFNETMVGLYQTVKGITPITIFELKSRYLNKIFDESSDVCFLINSKTLHLEQVPVSDKTRKDWISGEGMEDMLNKLIQDDIKKAPIVVDKKYYLFLVVDKGDVIELYRDINEVKEDDRDYVRPITYAELLFLAIIERVKKLHCTVTRYPIDSYGSIYISKVKLKITTKERKVMFKDYGAFEPITINNYPVLDTEFFNSMSVHYSRLSGLGADFDGDKTNLNFILTDEGNAEAEKLLNSREYYISVEGTPAFPIGNLITDLTLLTLTE